MAEKLTLRIPKTRANGSVMISEVIQWHDPADVALIEYDMSGPPNALTGSMSEYLIVLNDTNSKIPVKIISESVICDRSEIDTITLDPGEIARADKSCRTSRKVFFSKISGASGQTPGITSSFAEEYLFEQNSRVDTVHAVKVRNVTFMLEADREYMLEDLLAHWVEFEFFIDYPDYWRDNQSEVNIRLMNPRFSVAESVVFPVFTDLSLLTRGLEFKFALASSRTASLPAPFNLSIRPQFAIECRVIEDMSSLNQGGSGFPDYPLPPRGLAK